MMINTEGTEPIYVQIANWLETEILNEKIKGDEKMYSQYKLAEMFNINPATAAKGLNILVDDEILYKRRGLGMFVSANAREIVLQKRKRTTLEKLIEDVVREARILEVDEKNLIAMIKKKIGE
nr:GntR family transcriptional regulator [Alkaliphilus metalliredigens]